MATEIELERTFLARSLPAGLDAAVTRVITDHYLPADTQHPIIRLRANGDVYELTKKQPIDGVDSTMQHEHTIPLSNSEYDVFSSLPAKLVSKRRYDCLLDGHAAQVDVFQSDLAGLVVIDFEFPTQTAMAAFEPPDICLADVSQDVFIAGGVLAGKSYADIEPYLKKYNYQPLTVPGATA